MPRKKVTVKTDNSEWKAPKRRKPRKPMTEEQREVASKRLEKARAARLQRTLTMESQVFMKVFAVYQMTTD